MKIFSCPNCAGAIYFENTTCVECGSAIGFDSQILEFSIVDPIGGSQGRAYFARYCKNHEASVCNWLTEAHGDTYCQSCRLTRKAPGFGDAENLNKWRRLEFAKRRLVYQLIRLGLPVSQKTPGSTDGLVFDFLAKDNTEGAMTGHANGVITILLQEADSVEREQLRKQMSEPYRTLIGHFRHEIGHYYWPYLISKDVINQFREIFGDESCDYGKALERYYETGPDNGWRSNYISAYASSHPWEDWAETWAHYLHIMDTMETAHHSGIGLSRQENPDTPCKCPNPYLLADFEVIYGWSVELTCAGNNLNRSMGLQDIYPFVIPKPVYEKLSFVHTILKKTIAIKSVRNLQ